MRSERARKVPPGWAEREGVSTNHPRTGDVILRRKAVQRFKGFISEDLVYGYNELPNGLFGIDVYRFSATVLD